MQPTPDSRIPIDDFRVCWLGDTGRQAHTVLVQRQPARQHRRAIHRVYGPGTTDGITDDLLPLITAAIGVADRWISGWPSALPVLWSVRAEQHVLQVPDRPFQPGLAETFTHTAVGTDANGSHRYFWLRIP